MTIEPLKIVAVLGCTLISGVFFAFSTFVMKALARLEPAQGITAMKSINITVINPWFMTVFLGTAVVCLFLGIFSLLKGYQTPYLLIGSLFYLIGIGITIMFNVPLNDVLANLEPNSINSASVWNHYLNHWTFWNHIRTVTALTAAIFFMIRF